MIYYWLLKCQIQSACLWYTFLVLIRQVVSHMDRHYRIFQLKDTIIGVFIVQNITMSKYYRVQILQSTNIAKYKYYTVKILQSTNITKCKHYKVQILQSTNIVKYKY